MDKFQRKMEEISRISREMSEEEVNKAMAAQKKICLSLDVQHKMIV